jgi:hypothetical protein
VTLGNGGDGTCCIVSCAPFSHDYQGISEDVHVSENRRNAWKITLSSLIQAGYNGHVYYRIGGFPNPNGFEVKFTGVPYSFKLFLIEEARQMGFEKVLWLDSGCYCLQNPQILFDKLDQQELLANIAYKSFYDTIVFQPTLSLLNEYNENDIHTARYIITSVLGFNVKSELIRNVIKEYYNMVEWGLPFLSIFPEEIVLTSIFNKDVYRHVVETIDIHLNRMLRISFQDISLEAAKQQGYFFYGLDYSKL